MRFPDVDQLNETLPPLYAYLLALALSIFAIGLRGVILPASTGGAFATIYPFVILSFYICGSGPGLTTLILTSVAAFYFFLWPYETSFLTSEATWQILLYLMAAGFCGYIVNRLHQYRRELVQAHQRLMKEQDVSAAYDLALAVDGASLGIWRFIPEASVYTFSDKFAEHFGLPVGVLSVSYEKLLSIIHPEDRDVVHHALVRSMKDNVDFTVEHRVIMPDGSNRWIYANGKPLQTKSGATRQIDGITIDITERKLVELANRTNLSLIKATFDSVNEAILIGDLEGNLQAYNDAAVRFFHFEPTEPFFKNMAEFSERFDISTIDNQPVEHPYTLALRGIQKTYEIKVKNKLTGKIWYALSGTSPIRNEKMKSSARRQPRSIFRIWSSFKTVLKKRSTRGQRNSLPLIRNWSKFPVTTH